MNKFIKRKINNFIEPYVKLNNDDNVLIFELNKHLPFSKIYLIIKNRKTGKRIAKKFKNSKISLTNNDLLEINELGYYDIYLKIDIFKKSFLKRVLFDNQNKGKKLIDSDNNLIFKSYPTKFKSLSFVLKEHLFNAEIKSITPKNNHLNVNGELSIFDNNIEFDKIEIKSKSNKGNSFTIPCSYRYEKNKLFFEFNIKPITIKLEDINSFWRLDIRLKNEDIILDSFKLFCDNISDFTKYEDYFIHEFESIYYQDDEIEELNPILLFYATKKYEFKFQIISKDMYKSNLKVAKQRDSYDYYKKTENIDNNLIFFESFHGKYNNNPKYIYKKMLELGYDKKYTMVWSYDYEDEIEGNPIIVNSDEDDYYKYLAKAKYRINNTTFPIIDERDGRIYVQTWHGTPIKRLGNDINVRNAGVGWGHFSKESKTWDYLISANNFSTETFKRAFSFKGNVLEYGYPANDIFYFDNSKLKYDLANKYNIPINKKIILYAPTFRDNKKDENGNRYFELDLDLKKLYDELHDKFFLIIKTHYVVSKNLEINEQLNDFVIDLSNHEDIHELFVISDILITDYSSSFFDFSHSKKPILFFMPDMEEYMGSRGLYDNVFNELPGPKLINNDELISSLKNLNNVKKDYEDRYDDFYNKYCKIGNGNASEKIIKKIFG